MHREFLLYGHGGAYNHGAEAIVKCTVELIKSKFPDSWIILSSHFKEQDVEFNMPVDEYCQRDMSYVLMDKASNQKGRYDKLIYKSSLERITSDTVCLSVGGDNYCYDNWSRWRTIHEQALKVGAKSVLWSCSIEPSMIDDRMLDTLRSHNIITARESLTYNILIDKGLNNVKLCSDVAFLLKPKENALPSNFIEGNTVAINVSPLVARREMSEGILIENIKTIIEFITNDTDMNIALIPHVVMPMDNDYSILYEIYKGIRKRERVCLVSDKLDAAEYKYIISNCRFGIFARTHASIAAYSSCIPSLAIGYSVKSKGIALDLGSEDYVLPIGNFSNRSDLLLIFKSLLENEHSIRQILNDKKVENEYNAMGNVRALYDI